VWITARWGIVGASRTILEFSREEECLSLQNYLEVLQGRGMFEPTELSWRYPWWGIVGNIQNLSRYSRVGELVL